MSRGISITTRVRLRDADPATTLALRMILLMVGCSMTFQDIETASLVTSVAETRRSC
jgi:hypothetical protein